MALYEIKSPQSVEFSNALRALYISDTDYRKEEGLTTIALLAVIPVLLAASVATVVTIVAAVVGTGLELGSIAGQLGGLDQSADLGRLNVVRIEGIVGSGLALGGNLVLTGLTEANGDGLEGPGHFLGGLVVAAAVGLSKGHDQIAAVIIPAVVAQVAMVGTDHEIGDALVVGILMLDAELVRLQNDALEDLQGVLIVHDGLDHTVVGQSNHENVAVVASIRGSPDGDLGRKGAVLDGGRDTGVGLRHGAAVVSTDHAGQGLESAVIQTLHSLGGSLDHDALVALVIILGPGALADNFLGNQMIVNVVKRHSALSFR